MQVHAEAMKIASKLADGAIEGLKAIVHSHDHALISSLDDQLEYEKKTQRKLCDAPPFKEGIMAFLEKRKPNFRKYYQFELIRKIYFKC